jgi:hypothetical protein
MKVVSLKKKTQKKTLDNARWPVDCLLKQIGDFDEVVILARKKGEDSYTRFSSKLTSTFWWVGALEGIKQSLMDESLVLVEKGDDRV